MLDNLIYVLINRKVNLPGALKKLQGILNMSIVANQITELIKLIKELDLEASNQAKAQSGVNMQEVRFVDASEKHEVIQTKAHPGEAQAADTPLLKRNLSQSPQLARVKKNNQLKKQGSFANLPSSEEHAEASMPNTRKASRFFQRQQTQKLEVSQRLKNHSDQIDDDSYHQTEQLDPPVQLLLSSPIASPPLV